MAEKIKNEKSVVDRDKKKLSKADKERIRKEKLKLAEYCPKVSGCSWDYAPRKK